MAKKKGAKAAKQPIKKDETDSEVEITFDKAGLLDGADDLDGGNAYNNVDEDGNDLGGLMATLMATKGNKKGGKKGKKNRNADDEEDAAAILARLDLEDNPPAEEEPAASKKGGKKGKKAAAAVDNDDDAESADVVEPAPKAGGGKKGKKGKNKADDFDAEMDQIAAAQEEEEAEAPSPAAKAGKGKAAVKAAPADDDEEQEAGGEIRIKSKKEKERERKERAKLAAKQKTQSKGSKASPASTPGEPAAAAVEEPAEEEKAGGKKKGAAAAAGGKKKPAAIIAALREARLAQEAAEEEARRQAEEEERLLAEEQAREAEEERKREEAKARKKEKEKAKKEELKKAGKYLTPAQKAAQAAQKARLEAMIAAGMKVEGLEDAQAEEEEAEKKPKKVVYVSRKKKQGSKAEQEAQEAAAREEQRLKQEEEKRKRQEAAAKKEAAEAAASKTAAEEEAERMLAILRSGTQPAAAVAEDASDEDVKDAWDATSEEEEDVKDSWDQESDEEQEKPAPKAVAASSANTKAGSGKAASVAKSAAAKPSATPAKSSATAGKIAQKGEPEPSDDDSEDSSEDESDSDDDEDDSEEDSDEDDSEEELTAVQKQALKRKEEAAARRQERVAQAMAARSEDDLRSPICCILGHVDTGKTKLLDKVRQTNVQEGEAGGITQQIGATYFPMSAIKEKTALLHKGADSGYKLPGLLIIDTPGHESFTNLRSRGSSLCNIAILVVDIVHGLEPQTLESLGLLRQRKTPFIVALNKIDRMYDWKALPDHPTRDTLAQQKPHTIKEFDERVKKTILEFAEQGLNACLYWDNTNFAKNVSLVPTSAITGEGIPDLLHLLIDLTQNRMTKNLMYLSELECTVLEVKVIEGLGTTIDVVLSNGVLNEGDRICVCGLNGPIITTVRALLTPQPMKELRIKSQYVHHKSVKASLGIKISAPDLEKAIAGSRLMVIGPDDDEDDIKGEVMSDLVSLSDNISSRGVTVQASTLGSLEALLSFLKSSKIPVSGINIGPVHKKDVIRASTMLERAREYAQLLAFDVPIDKDAAQLAEELGVKIFSAEIIYHLFDSFTAYMKEMEEKKRADAAPKAIFPCALRIVPGMVFSRRNPIILGVDVTEGSLRIGTPLAVWNEEAKAVIKLGRVTSIELNHKAQQEAKKGGPGVAIKIECAEYETPKLFGRHFTEKNEIYSAITRPSIEILKDTFRNDLSKEDWQLVIRLKKVLRIE
ncbi:hypothetical protein HDU87_006606 [Geranomyces variabilis]|uniref:Eukaryotic translation initiation factor 5B n=1 Tax=Geranomyces variabilis TaxID=109894 RepID=A0AAD5TKK3_9FUNG|nr:hypothetical protein HDU87_006606 [Geranomyces variabilis]